MIDLVSSEVSLFSRGEVDAIIGVCTGGVSAAAPLPALSQLELRVVPSVQPMMQPPSLQPEPPSSLQRLRPASDAAEGPWLERWHLDSRRARFACWSSSGRGGPSTESSCSVINSWNKFTAAAILSQNEHRTRVKCRMWMLVLTWMYFSSHRPLHQLLTLYNQNLSFGQKITDSADHTRKMGSQTSSKPSTLSPA